MLAGSGSTPACSAATTATTTRTPVWLIVIVVSIVTYVISYILILALSRYREYAADRGAALITGAPEHLMSALQKIASQMTRIPQRDLREVAGDERVLHRPDELEAGGRRALPDAPAAREAARAPRRRSPGRWAGRSRRAG